MFNLQRQASFAAVACTLLALTVPANAGSPKSGWAGGDANDHNGSNSSWYYRWWHTVPPDASGTFAEFVPLIKFPTPQNLTNNLNAVAALPNVDTLMFLNEPERETQSDRTVAEAISMWPTVQNRLPDHRLVGPNIGDDQGGRAWLDDFMTQREAINTNADPSDDLRLDALAFHWYGASSPNAVGAANNFLSRVDWYHQEYGLPLWITEFAMHDWEGNDPTAAMIQANADFLEIVIPELESRSYVERYSYYNWFDDATVWVDDPRGLPRIDPNIPNPPPADRMPSVIGDVLVGTTQLGEVRDLAGQSLGTDIAYLRGGELTNNGSALPDALRGVDSLEGVGVISGATDWSMINLRQSFTRVRQGATLRKSGPNKIELTGALRLEGDLEVAEGVLRLAGTTPAGDGGAIRVLEGATLEIAEGRSVYTIPAREFFSAGVVDGAVRFTAGATVVPEGLTPTFTSNLTVQDTTVDVGGAGFTVVASTVEPVSTQLRLDFNAALDTPGDSVWEDATGSSIGLTFAGLASPTTVSDPTFPGVFAAYPIGDVGGAEGLNQFFENGGPRSRQDASFEVVFRVDSTSAGADQVLMEVGGAGRGVAFVLNDDTLTFNVDGDANDIDLTTVVSEGWNHAVGVIDLSTGNDAVALFVNGQQIGSLSGQTIGDWSGGNLSGLGAGASSVTGVSSGVGAPFHGALAIARYYEGFAFDNADVLQNYDALTTTPMFDPTTLVVEGNFTSQGASDLRLDIGAAGVADRIAVDGTLAVTGGTLSVAYVGEAAIAAGDLFDLFDFASAVIDFDSVALPDLDPSLSWSLTRLSIDGVLAVVLAGDFNADGAVDAADYTVWRDSLATNVMPFTAGDANGDGQVNEVDLLAWRTNFGATVAGLAAGVPEPTGWLLGAFACFTLFNRGRR